MISENEVFLLEANVFIEPKNRFYPFDVFPGYWDFLLQELGGERVKSITHVYDELMGHEDDLSDWAKQLGRKRFADCTADADVFARYLDVASYVRSLEGSGKSKRDVARLRSSCKMELPILGSWRVPPYTARRS